MAAYWFKWSMVGCSCISNDLVVHFCLQWSSCSWIWLPWSRCGSSCRDLKPGVCLYTLSSITVRNPNGIINTKQLLSLGGKIGILIHIIFPGKLSQNKLHCFFRETSWTNSQRAEEAVLEGLFYGSSLGDQTKEPFAALDRFCFGFVLECITELECIMDKICNGFGGPASSCEKPWPGFQYQTSSLLKVF